MENQNSNQNRNALGDFTGRLSATGNNDPILFKYFINPLFSKHAKKEMLK